MSVLTKRSFLTGLFSVAAATTVASEGAKWMLERDNPFTRPSQKDQEVAALTDELALLPSRTSNNTTIGFDALAVKNPWLKTIQNSIGRYEIQLSDNNLGAGSSVLLDRQGTVVLCAHEVKFPSTTKAPVAAPMLSFWSSNNELVQTNATNIVYDEAHDLAFATIDPSFIAQNGLNPIQWGQMGPNKNWDRVSDIIGVGFPSHSQGRLHASKGTVDDYVSSAEKWMGNVRTPTNCEILANFTAVPGMSGGGAFRDGAFVGTLNAGKGSGLKASSYFTPVDVIKTAYQKLYPDRVQNVGMDVIGSSPETATMPNECAVNRRNFLAALFPTPR